MTIAYGYGIRQELRTCDTRSFPLVNMLWNILHHLSIHMASSLRFFCPVISLFHLLLDAVAVGECADNRSSKKRTDGSDRPKHTYLVVFERDGIF